MLNFENWIEEYHNTHAVCHDGVSWPLIRLISNYLDYKDKAIESIRDKDNGSKN